ncbi:MAG: 3-hydroxy-5-methyl-1-naphthoate 3-O-methyltransferase [Chlamydiae bacterium]|nr:3-hydroxy-5-methyl-1-naphthoate 3-O-methyltransferase [Chlamydiota bacterium]
MDTKARQELQIDLKMISNDNSITDEKLQLITGQILVGQAILLAYKLGLFKCLSNGPKSLDELVLSMNLSERSIQSLISCAAALDFVKFNSGKYSLSLIGNKYLNENKTEYYGSVLDLLIEQNEIMSLSSVERAILQNTPQVDNGIDIFSDRMGLGNTNKFVSALHHKAFAPAFHWPTLLNLNPYKKLVDIGGGSGIHTIAACKFNSSLRGLVCDRKPVLEHSNAYIDAFQLNDRVSTTEIDLWEGDYFPEGDICFFGDIFHDWDPGKCLVLAKKCFNTLPKDGLIILHEMLFNEQKTGPFLTSAYNLKMMLWTEGQQFSFSELKTILKKTGFYKIRKIKSLGNWSIVIGEKP